MPVAVEQPISPTGQDTAEPVTQSVSGLARAHRFTSKVNSLAFID